MKYDQCCLQGSDFKVVISQLTEKFITFIKTSLESTGHLRWEFPDRAFDIAEIFKNSFLDERIISCQIKIYGTSVRRSSGRRSGLAVRAVDCWQ